jgi:hypothetical protein
METGSKPKPRLKLNMLLKISEWMEKRNVQTLFSQSLYPMGLFIQVKE